MCESERRGFCSKVTRLDWMWKQSEKRRRKVVRSEGVLNILNHVSCGNLDVVRWKSWSTRMGPRGNGGDVGGWRLIRGRQVKVAGGRMINYEPIASNYLERSFLFLGK